jgi:hypothetical protein
MGRSAKGQDSAEEVVSGVLDALRRGHVRQPQADGQPHLVEEGAKGAKGGQVTNEEAWDDRCPMCGGPNEFEDAGDIRIPVNAAEVVNKTTGARGLAHAECYLADTCCYELA